MTLSNMLRLGPMSWSMAGSLSGRIAAVAQQRDDWLLDQLRPDRQSERGR